MTHYDRELIARMLEDYDSPGPYFAFTRDAVMTQAQLLRSANNSEPQGLDAAVEAEFEIHAGGDYYATVSGPRDRAWADAMHYVSTLTDADGKPEVFEVTKRAVPIGAQPPHLRGQVPDGYVLVQIRDARNLIEHVQHSVTSQISARRVRDLIAAAPAAPVQPVVDEREAFAIAYIHDLVDAMRPFITEDFGIEDQAIAAGFIRDYDEALAAGTVRDFITSITAQPGEVAP